MIYFRIVRSEQLYNDDEKQAEVANIIDEMPDKRVVEDSISEDVGVQVWRDENNRRLIVHLINYDFDPERGVVDKENIPISINLPLGDVPTSLKLTSPHLPGEQILNYSFSDGKLSFEVPNLHVWDVVTIELKSI